MVTKTAILVVDDNEDYCDGIVDLLEIENYKVVGVHDGFKAIEAIREDKFGMVLMDVRMPGMDGIETFQKLKELSPETPIILMTAYVEEGRINNALREGIFGAFYKPIDFDRLICSMEKAVPDGAVVMVAVDDDEYRSDIFGILTESGYRAVVVSDNETAIRTARENRFDIIILGMELQLSDCLEVYSTIRDFRPNTNIVVVTDNKDETGKVVDHASKKNICTFFEKTLDADNLLEVVQKTLENRD